MFYFITKKKKSKQQDQSLMELHPENETYVDSDANDSDFVPKTKPKVAAKRRTSRVKPRYDLKNKVMYEWDEKSNKFHKQPIKISKVVELTDSNVQKLKPAVATAPTHGTLADNPAVGGVTIKRTETETILTRGASISTKMSPSSNKASPKAPDSVHTTDSVKVTTLARTSNTLQPHTKDATTQTPPVPMLSTVTTTTSSRNIREIVENEMAQIASTTNKRKHEDEDHPETKTTRVRAARGYERSNQAESAPNNPFGNHQRRVIKREFPYHSIVRWKKRTHLTSMASFRIQGNVEKPL